MCHCGSCGSSAIVPSYLRGYFVGSKFFLVGVSWVLFSCEYFVGPNIFSRRYFVGPKCFLVDILWVRNFSRGYFIGQFFFLWVVCGSKYFSISWIQIFFSGVFCGAKVYLVGISRVWYFLSHDKFCDSKIFSCSLHEKGWQKTELYKYISNHVFYSNRLQQLSVLFILKKWFIY